MALYFFDIQDGQDFSRDAVGSECDGHEAVRLIAMRTLPVIAKDTIPTDGNLQCFMVSVRDESDVTVYTATLTFAGLWMGDVPIPDPEEDILDQ